MMYPDYFTELKRYLYIDFTDDDTDRKLLRDAKRAESMLDRLIGYSGDYSLEMKDQDLLQLLFSLIRYIRENAEFEFSQDYADDIWSKRMNHTVDQAEAEDQQNEG